jgi:hypothetical protein
MERMVRGETKWYCSNCGMETRNVNGLDIFDQTAPLRPPAILVVEPTASDVPATGLVGKHADVIVVDDMTENAPFNAWSFESKTAESEWRKHDYCWPTPKMASKAMAAETLAFLEYGVLEVRLIQTRKWKPGAW